MKNRRNIVEQKYPPENPNDIWLKDGKFYRSTSEGWVVIDSETEYTSKESMVADNPKGGTIGIDKETGEASIYNGVARQWSPLGGGGGGMTETTWQELKDKRDAGELTPGSLYRITDYNCTTTQENTQSAGHQFDIVLLALSANKLAEEGWAMMNESNIYDVTFADGVTKKCYLYFFDDDIDCNIVLAEDLTKGLNLGIGKEDFIELDETNKTAEIDVWSYYDGEHGDGFITVAEPNVQYNYFQNSNLSAWKVWYCLDNDTERFAWASDKDYIENTSARGKYYRDTTLDSIYEQEQYYGWITDNSHIVYTKNEHPSIGEMTYDEDYIDNWEIPKMGFVGTGVIYRLIDEFNNDVAYDFKNIQFVRPLTDGAYDTNGNNTWVYTFNVWYNNASEDASVIGNTLVDDTPMVCGVAFNKINEVRPTQGSTQKLQVCLNDVVFLTTEDSGLYVGTTHNNCLNSCNCTITWCQNVDIEHSVNLNIEGCDMSKFYACFGDYDSWTYCFVINNKKVLTES